MKIQELVDALLKFDPNLEIGIIDEGYVLSDIDKVVDGREGDVPRIYVMAYGCDDDGSWPTVYKAKE